MPAEVYGILRDEATYGEKETLKFLRQNLPKEYSVFVEPPLHKKRELRYPDFVVLTNYGVIVLEVKDWVHIESADPSGASIRTRQNEVRREYNPVDKAREFALLLSNNLNENHNNDRTHSSIPWGFAAVLPNLGNAVITQIRRPWGEEFVISKADLENPNYLQSRLKNTIKAERISSHGLTKLEQDYIRATIFPIVNFTPPNRPTITIDPIQTKLVSETPKKQAPEVIAPTDVQPSLIPVIAPEPLPPTPDIVESLFENASIRLVRGLAGSGKTLVLIQRAKYLAECYPEWKILVLSFNNALAANLKTNFVDHENITTLNFHKLCTNLLPEPLRKPDNPNGWIQKTRKNYPELADYSVEFLSDEIAWIKDMALIELELYLSAERKGRGKQQRLMKETRKMIFRLMRDYDADLQSRNIPDWADVPHIVLRKIEAGEITVDPYDVILIDEAQDFAPSWISVVKKIIKPDNGVIFLADDPTQSIYKYYSWKEKGIPVVGRTARLLLPYRNTYQIFQVANALVHEDEVLTKILEAEDMSLPVDLDPAVMRQGDRPVIFRTDNILDEVDFIKRNINSLVAKEKLDLDQIVVLCRSKRNIDRIKKHLKGTDVIVNTFHSYKGMEAEAVFLCGMQETFSDKEDENEVAEEKKLVYMALTRARQKLFLSYVGQLPRQLRGITEFMDVI